MEINLEPFKTKYMKDYQDYQDILKGIEQRRYERQVGILTDAIMNMTLQECFDYAGTMPGNEIDKTLIVRIKQLMEG